MIALIVFSAIGVVIAFGIPKIAQPGRSKLATAP
jgi:hypothetical protein